MEVTKWGGIIIDPFCSNNCVFCKGYPKLSFKELKQQEDNIRLNLHEFKKNGVSGVEISGGDPIDYPHIISLIKKIKKMGFKEVQLSTHGKRLSDMNFLMKLSKSGLDKLRIPLYGSTAKIHDAITRSPGSFNQTLEGLKNVQNTGLYTQISCLILQQNKENLSEIIELITKLDVGDLYFASACILNNDYSNYVPLKNLEPYIKKILKIALESRIHIHFIEIPFCVFGKKLSIINNHSAPPDMGKACQPPKEFQSEKKDWPSYRLKTKAEICKNCSVSINCDGFFVNDIKKFGTGNLVGL